MNKEMVQRIFPFYDFFFKYVWVLHNYYLNLISNSLSGVFLKWSSIISRDIRGAHALDRVLLLNILSDNIKHFLVYCLWIMPEKKIRKENNYEKWNVIIDDLWLKFNLWTKNIFLKRNSKKRDVNFYVWRNLKFIWHFIEQLK